MANEETKPPAPQKFVHPLDRILGPPSEGGVERIDPGAPTVANADVNAPAPEIAPPAPAPAEGAPPPATPAIETAPPVAPPLDAPPPAPAEAEPAEGEGEGEREAAPEGDAPKKPRRPRWDEVREADKRAREGERRALELERENAALRARMLAEQAAPAREPAIEPTEPPDPLTALEQRQARLEEENRALQAQVSQRTLESQIKAQEDAYRREHPEYDDAFKHFVKAEREEAEEAGFLDDASAHLRATQRPLVMNVALSRNMSEDEAAKEIAFSAMIQARRDAIVAASRRTGRAIPEIVVAIARRRGYVGAAAAGAGTTAIEDTGAPPANGNGAAKPASPKPSAADLRSAATSLSNVPRSPAPPVPDQPKTRRDMLAHLGSLTLEERDRYLEKLDKDNPRWAESLA